MLQFFVDNIYVEVLSSLPEITGNSFGVEVFPNPTTGIIQLLNNKKSTDPIILEVINVNGEQVKKMTIHPEAPIDLQSLTPGLYFLGITLDGFTNYRKIIKS